MSTFNISGSCERGLVRSTNQDAILIGTTLLRDATHGFKNLHRAKQWAFVADGMGGHAFGEIASQMALEYVNEELKNAPWEKSKTFRRFLRKMVADTHAHLLAKQFEFGNFGTTLCGVVTSATGRFFLINVGDSRLYRYRNKKLMQLSTDHSLRVESKNYDFPANIITSSIGGGNSQIKIQIENISHRIKPTDILMICSDGLSEYVSHKAIEMEFQLSSQDLPERLLKLAMLAGAPDNVSIIIIEQAE